MGSCETNGVFIYLEGQLINVNKFFFLKSEPFRRFYEDFYITGIITGQEKCFPAKNTQELIELSKHHESCEKCLFQESTNQIVTSILGFCPFLIEYANNCSFSQILATAETCRVAEYSHLFRFFACTLQQTVLPDEIPIIADKIRVIADSIKQDPNAANGCNMI
uniref:Saposin B-type domain-containing protein n=1 Tax=Rhabditophanes sp. KR3021 TaxID=114890 RepID=A0AC35TG65_9BILA